MDSPLLVLIPGLDGSGNLFEPFIKCVGGKYEVLVTNYANSGLNSIEEVVNFVKKQIPEDRSIVLIAESFGGVIALKLLTGGLKTRGCVFCATFVSTPREKLINMLKILPLGKLPRLLIPKLLIRHLLLCKNSSPKMEELIFKTICSLKPSTLALKIKLLSKVDCYRELKLLPDIPYLYILPQTDLLVSRKYHIPFLKHLVRIKLVNVQGGHFILQSSPKRCWIEISKFLTLTPQSCEYFGSKPF